MSLVSTYELNPAARTDLRTTTWRTNLDAAPFGTPLSVRVPQGDVPLQDTAEEHVGIRKADHWLVILGAGRVVSVPAVSAWRSIAPAPEKLSFKSVLSGVRRTASSICAAPNLFVLGAGKCGTTSLHAILRQHPDIHATRIKEPTFFCSSFQTVSDPLAYFQLFDSTARYRVESSHAYLTDPDAAATLHTVFPNAKFILTLRNPKNRAHSLYRHMRRLKHEGDQLPYENISDFTSALRAEPERYRSQEFFDNCRQYFWNFLYCRSSFYDEQLKRYLSLFNRSQFHIVSLAELSTNPVGTTKDIARFLDLDPAPVDDFRFDIKNRSRDAHASHSDDSDRIMNAAFEGLTDRTDRLIGRPLDWSI